MLSKLLQSETYSAAGVLRAAEILRDNLSDLRTDASYSLLMAQVTARANELQLKEFAEPRAT